jgi:hypothetical protein
MKNIDLFSILFILVGSIMVYGSKHILRFLKIELNDMKVIIFKLVGLVIACVGFFRILDII